MNTSTDAIEILDLYDRLDDVAKRLVFHIIEGLARGRLTCGEVGTATDRILAGADKIETLENLVQLANERLFDCGVDHG